MSRTDLFNTVLLTVALVTSGYGVLHFHTYVPPPTTLPPLEPDTIERVSLPDGRLAIKDAHDALVPLGTYNRVMSLGLASDALLAEICEPDRIIAVSSYSRGALALRFSNKQRLAGLDDLESIIAAEPDLVFVSSTPEQIDRITRLREAGLIVCDLGEQGGIATLIPNARRIGALLRRDKQVNQWLEAFSWRLQNVSASLPPERPRRRALYLSLFGRDIYGGTTGSSFHDVLTAAGLIDVAAEKYNGWPALSLEQIVELDPEVIVTSPTSLQALRALPGTRAINALQRPDGVITLPADLLNDPGPRLIDAAEALFRAAYPPRTSSTDELPPETTPPDNPETTPPNNLETTPPDNPKPVPTTPAAETTAPTNQ